MIDYCLQSFDTRSLYLQRLVLYDVFSNFPHSQNSHHFLQVAGKSSFHFSIFIYLFLRRNQNSSKIVLHTRTNVLRKFAAILEETSTD